MQIENLSSEIIEYTHLAEIGSALIVRLVSSL